MEFSRGLLTQFKTSGEVSDPNEDREYPRLNLNNPADRVIKKSLFIINNHESDMISRVRLHVQFQNLSF